MTTQAELTVAAILIALLYWIVVLTLFVLTIASVVRGNIWGAVLYGLTLIIWFAIWWVDWWIFLVVAIVFLVFHLLVHYSQSSGKKKAKISSTRGKKKTIGRTIGRTIDRIGGTRGKKNKKGYKYR